MYIYLDSENKDDCTKLAGTDMVVLDCSDAFMRMEELAVNSYNLTKIGLNKVGSSVQIQHAKDTHFLLRSEVLSTIVFYGFFFSAE